MKRKKKGQERFKTIRKHVIDGVVVSRLIESRLTGKRKLICDDINRVCNR